LAAGGDRSESAIAARIEATVTARLNRHPAAFHPIRDMRDEIR
jgi:hypothetical protein